MKIDMDLHSSLRSFVLCVPAAALLSACQTMPPSNIGSKAAPSVHPSQAVWRCTGNVTLGIQRVPEGLEIVDSRGFDVTLSPDPPGQGIRYGANGYAFVIEGRTASWFAIKRLPKDCVR